MKSIITIVLAIGLQNASSYMLNRNPIGNHVFGREILQKITTNSLPENHFKKYSSMVDGNKKTAIFLPALTGNSATAGLYEKFLNIMTKKSFDIYVP